MGYIDTASQKEMDFILGMRSNQSRNFRQCKVYLFCKQRKAIFRATLTLKHWEKNQ